MDFFVNHIHAHTNIYKFNKILKFSPRSVNFTQRRKKINKIIEIKLRNWFVYEVIKIDSDTWKFYTENVVL